MKYIIFVLTIVIAVSVFAANLIVIVPDGFTFDGYSLLRKISSDPRRSIAFDRVKHVFVYETTTDNTYITDSAASGTAMFTGQKTNTDVIGQDKSAEPREKDGKNIPNIIEFVKSNNMLSGIVTNTRVTHATPACTYGHVNDRYYEWELGDQLSRKGIDIVLGGGTGNMLTIDEICPLTGNKGKRKDGIKALSNMINGGYTFISDREELNTLDLNTEKVLGLFSYSHMNYEWEKPETEPTLYEMGKKSIEYLHNKSKKENKDFFLMIEAGRIDHAAHEISTEKYMWEIFEYEKLSDFVMDYCDSTETTLLIIPDHATANPIFTGSKDSLGFYVYDSYFVENEFVYPDKEAFKELIKHIDVHWTTSNGETEDAGYRGEHTGSDVLGLMYGKYSYMLNGFLSNTDFFESMKRILKK